VGSLALGTKDSQLYCLKYCRSAPATQKIVDPFKQDVINALNKYFFEQIAIPDFPYTFSGTLFQKKVWLALCRIPFGETRTYGELAKKLNTSAQAVGNACRENPISIIIPCHRVVSRVGLGGYGGKVSGSKIKIKTWLLRHEGAI
tara:strand:+ start:23407 stop:23841 length:435 start_codon:yes stop_codon:yes gene_type:complete